MIKKNVALVAGGYSGEYEVSLNSAKNIAANLNTDKYQVYTILITRDRWFYQGEHDTIEVDKNDFSIQLNNSKINFDVAFITVHGTPGEDGKLQGYFDMLGIPYNTCDATTSAVTMNKAYTKTIVHSIKNLYTARSLQLFRKDIHDVATITAALHFPLFIKPNNGGSSVGMSKVHNVAALPSALEKAFHEDAQILIEEFIQGREFSIGIASLHGKVTVLPPTEIISSKEFFDYEAKYTPGVTQEITPADIETEKLKEISTMVKEIYLRLNCRGMVRVDFILQENTNHFYFIEINTTPGQSANSLIPQQVRAAGMQVSDFYEAILEGSTGH
jgi:D-alanine-D-alanine ligase